MKCIICENQRECDIKVKGKYLCKECIQQIVVYDQKKEKLVCPDCQSITGGLHIFRTGNSLDHKSLFQCEDCWYTGFKNHFRSDEK